MNNPSFKYNNVLPHLDPFVYNFNSVDDSYNIRLENQNPELHFGSIGENVIELQHQLVNLHYLTGNPDGVFGLVTEEAVKKFQIDHHLVVDGIVGQETWAVLNREIQNPTPINQKPIIRYGDNSSYVKELQQKLSMLGYYNSIIDGNFGNVTEESVRQFQKNNNITVNGEVGPNTWRLINQQFLLLGTSTTVLNLPLTEGDVGESVRILQRGLKALNYYNGEVSGDFDPETTIAVEKFQSINNIPVTGTVNQQTWDLISTKILYTGEINNLGLKFIELSEGSSGSNVVILQEKLKLLHYFPGSVTGSFGPETTTSVQRFQEVYNLPATGIVDLNTWQVLLEETEKLTDYLDFNPGHLAKTDLRIGDTGKNVRELQIMLKTLLYYTGPIDGIFGNDTNISVRTLQMNNSITADGMVGPKTWNALYYLYSPQAKCDENQRGDTTPTMIHVVKKGDYLYALAKRYDTTVEKLMLWNGLTNDDLQVGDWLVVAPMDEEATYRIYQVRPGDTLWIISDRSQNDVNEIKRLNNLTNDTLKVGQHLVLRDYSYQPPISVTNGSSLPDAGSGYIAYIVKPGDYLYALAQRFNTTIKAIEDANHLTSDFLFVGQELKIPIK